jgi:hypothetical protein
MKRRIRKVANFFAFNLLFFALYLNFIHKDNSQVAPSSQVVQAPAFSETIIASHTQQPAETKTQVTEKNTGNNTAALKLSIN